MWSIAQIIAERPRPNSLQVLHEGWRCEIWEDVWRRASVSAAVSVRPHVKSHNYWRFVVWVSQRKTERSGGLRTVYNISGDINFSWSGYSFQHIHHSCTVTWLSADDPHPDSHTTIKTWASFEPAASAYCTVQWSAAVREAAWTSEVLECSNLYNNPTCSALAVLFFFFQAFSWHVAWRFVGGADKNVDSWMCQAEEVSH